MFGYSLLKYGMQTLLYICCILWREVLYQRMHCKNCSYSIPYIATASQKLWHNNLQSVCFSSIYSTDKYASRSLVFHSLRYGVWLRQAWDNDLEVFLFSSPQPHQVLLIHETAITSQPLSCVLMLVWSCYENYFCPWCNTQKLGPQTVMRAIKFKMFGKINLGLYSRLMYRGAHVHPGD